MGRDGIHGHNSISIICNINTLEDEMVGWHHRLSGREFEQALRDGRGLGSLVQFMGLQRAGHALAIKQRQ